jgi:hypothetical protein
MSLSNESLEERVGHLEQSRNFWRRLALGQLLLLAVVIVAGVAISGLLAVRAHQAQMIAQEEAHRAREAQARQQAEEAARAAEAEQRAREKDRK